ncbi:MAG: FmdE family protein [Thermodesulfobacteriota bacterium]
MCPGQVLGVRMGLLGLALLGYSAPLNERDIKKVIVFVEIDRCMADALATATGVKLGRRSLKFKDFGLMAATFLNLPDGRAYRLIGREDCRKRAAELAPFIIDRYQREVEVYQVLPASELFQVEAVTVEIKPEDLPGWQGEKIVCDVCGLTIRHGRVIQRDGRRLCLVCGGQGYFQRLHPVDGLDNLDGLVKSPSSGRGRLSPGLG